jgi:hypothetical protein
MKTLIPFLKPVASILSLFFVVSCTAMTTASPTPSPTALPPALGAGFRFSTYGPPRNPGAAYWASVGEQMAARFPNAQPEAIWIVGNFTGKGTFLSFPAESDDTLITKTYVDMNEAALTLFDQRGVRVWLQVEPGNADMITLIHLVLNQYSHHPCVIGFGVDVEWYKTGVGPEGTPVSDAEATAWVEAVRTHNPAYRLFLKHWDYNWMPPHAREGIVFVDDSQQFGNLEEMLANFAQWGEHFAPAPVAFQYGYPSDKPWWSQLQDPPGDIGRAILERVPNTSALFWVDFTALEVFPPPP